MLLLFLIKIIITLTLFYVIYNKLYGNKRRDDEINRQRLEIEKLKNSIESTEQVINLAKEKNILNQKQDSLNIKLNSIKGE